jgi:AraC family transcriptional regulator of adaptative response/methylated-DNA-[protein]-cysteine methyltransferase
MRMASAVSPGTLDERTSWRATRERDRRFDGRFVFAVRSTGIYCRPSCPARRPRRENVVFFPAPAEAEGSGFRPCRRCRPRSANAWAPSWIAEACRRLEAVEDATPGLRQLAAEMGRSPSHLQRTFKRVVGVSPRQYADAHRLRHVKARLKRGGTVTEALYDAGYGASSRLYERADQLGMSPGAYRSGGRGRRIDYAVVSSPLGWLLVGATERGVCAVALGGSESELLATLHKEYPAAEIRRDRGRIGPWVEQVVRSLDGGPDPDLPIDIRATAFQRRVWEELRAIPPGSTRTYGEIARRIGRPTAARAVARSCATNPVALVIPCHRVVAAGGGLGGYRWGVQRKRQLLTRESAKVR